jgi:hypothetical protein
MRRLPRILAPRGWLGLLTLLEQARLMQGFDCEESPAGESLS